MSYNKDDFPRYVKTAGKISVLAAVAGLFVFMMAFIFDAGTKELNKVSAQTATTSLTVLNTPPLFTLNPYETVESSTSSPTNSGDVITWEAIASDPNGADYFLLICSTNASPTPGADAPPTCGGGVQWGVSATTTDETIASVSTTTSETGTGQFLEIQEWYAWVCDSDSVDPRCSVIPEQGDYATSSSPFNVNDRPVLSANLTNDGPVDPGGTISWNSTSTDPDTVGGADSIYLVICNSNSDYDTNLNTCPNDFIASTTLQTILSDASATYTAPSIIRDDTYPAFGYLVDEHGHEALANPLQSNFDVNNVAPTVLGGDITLNGGSDLVLTNAGAGETTGFTLDFTIRDANSCLNAASSSEISTDSADHLISIFRSNNSTTTCSGDAADYDANDCYVNGVPPAQWNLSCTATTTCASPNQDYVDFSCTFPLWFLADPTDAGINTPAAFTATNWTAGIAGLDDDLATGTMATTSNPVDLNSAPYIEMDAYEIAYGGVEPGNDTGTLSASSTLFNIGNTGLDQDVQGTSMCDSYSLASPCPNSASSTVPDEEQQFASTSLAYNSPLALSLSSTTDQEVELDVLKTTATSSASWQEGVTYWGIAVPASITLAGSYSGLNTFTAVVAEAVDWTP